MTAQRRANSFARREFFGAALGGATLAARAGLAAAGAPQSDAAARAAGIQAPIRHALDLANQFVLWQSDCGGLDPVKCPYRTPGRFNAYHLHGFAPMLKALYRIYEETGAGEYKAAADRFAVFYMNCIHDPREPYVSKITLDGAERNLLSSAWMFGKALSPCYELFCRHNPREDAFELKAHAVYRWLQKHRRKEGYFGVGYPLGDQPDAQFSCDLAEVGNGLIGFFTLSKHEPALTDALGLAEYFLTEHVKGSGRGVWSSRLGTWLVGPWSGTGAEHFEGQDFSQVGWGFSSYLVADFLLRLRPHVADKTTRDELDDKCTKALGWCYEACQFDDGAHGMFGRDDKWVGMAAAAVLLHTALMREKILSPESNAAFAPRLKKTWRWLFEHTGRETYPPDGYLKVSGKTSKKPLENLIWLMAWTAEALIEGSRLLTAEG
ncbi:MAG TPA: hypothetical protein VKU82_07715 [Planctomycetaceae bacterium]|nr:hypothetical protein [Planctomycetaceae bacterium]